MKTYAFVFARGGSKGLPRKNIRKLAGKPLLAYSIEQAEEINAIDELFVSTEDPAIAAVALEYGANVIDRPAKLAQDDTPEWLAWQHAVEWIQKQGDLFDIFLSLPTTAPLRNSEDILGALKKLDDRTDAVLTMTHAARSPWFNMVKKGRDEYIELLIQNKKKTHHRQDAPVVFDLTTVAYVTRPEFILSHDAIFEGRLRAVEIPRERALDIDTEMDLEIAEFLMQRQSGKKQLISDAK